MKAYVQVGTYGVMVPMHVLEDGWKEGASGKIRQGFDRGRDGWKLKLELVRGNGRHEIEPLPTKRRTQRTGITRGNINEFDVRMTDCQKAEMKHEGLEKKGESSLEALSVVKPIVLGRR